MTTRCRYARLHGPAVVGWEERGGGGGGSLWPKVSCLSLGRDSLGVTKRGSDGSPVRVNRSEAGEGGKDRGLCGHEPGVHSPVLPSLTPSPLSAILPQPFRLYSQWGKGGGGGGRERDRLHSTQIQPALHYNLHRSRSIRRALFPSMLSFPKGDILLAGVTHAPTQARSPSRPYVRACTLKRNGPTECLRKSK